MNKLSFVYFGGDPIGAPILRQLIEAGFIPKLVIANPDKPVGRKQIITKPAVKEVAEAAGIPVFQPEDYKDKEALQPILKISADVHVVVAYNHILPKGLIEQSEYGTVNVHPSLLPKYRGANPIRSAILNDEKEVGVSIMKLDEEMDHGPILAQEKLSIKADEWPLMGRDLDSRLAALGGQLLIDTLPNYIAGQITPKEQDHDQATYTRKVTRLDGELTIDPHNLPSKDEAYSIYLKICAFDGWPETFFVHKGKRVKIKEATLAKDGSLRLVKVTPEGKYEMDFSTFLSSH